MASNWASCCLCTGRFVPTRMAVAGHHCRPIGRGGGASDRHGLCADRRVPSRGRHLCRDFSAAGLRAGRHVATTDRESRLRVLRDSGGDAGTARGSGHGALRRSGRRARADGWRAVHRRGSRAARRHCQLSVSADPDRLHERHCAQHHRRAAGAAARIHDRSSRIFPQAVRDRLADRRDPRSDRDARRSAIRVAVRAQARSAANPGAARRERGWHRCRFDAGPRCHGSCARRRVAGRSSRAADARCGRQRSRLAAVRRRRHGDSRLLQHDPHGARLRSEERLRRRCQSRVHRARRLQPGGGARAGVRRERRRFTDGGGRRGRRQRRN